MKTLLTLLFAILSPPSATWNDLAGAVHEAPRRVSMGSSWIAYRPTSLRVNDEGEYDLVIHFHGVPEVVERQFEGSRINALLVTVNLGIGSRAYHAHFSDSGGLDRRLALIQQTVWPPIGGRTPRLGRIALSAWSAGHGAQLAILAHPQHRARVDAVLIADGLHGAFSDRRSRAIDPQSLAPFIEFGRMAADGEKLMLVTHSEIVTPDYASTSESSSYLGDALGLPRAASTPLPAERTRGQLSIVGIAGNDAAAHAVHLRSMADLTLEKLRRWWQR